MAAKFEKVSRFNDAEIAMPVRKTAYSAGYDLVAAEDVIIKPYDSLLADMWFGSKEVSNTVKTLDEVAAITKATKAKPTLVSTGMKCKLDPGTYLELSVRSSSPLKYWLMLANGVGKLN